MALWFSTPRDFSECLETIAELEKLLECNLCKKMMRQPVTLWSCEHVFCQKCITNTDNCHICSLPAWTEDQRENMATTSIARLTASLRGLLEDYMKETNQIQAADSGINKNEDKIAKGVDDIITDNNESNVQSTTKVKLRQRRSSFRNAPSKPFSDIPTDSEETQNGNTDKIENSDAIDVTPIKSAVKKMYKNSTAKTITKKFASPLLRKGKRSMLRPYSTEMTTPKRFSSPQRSPGLRTPKTPKSNKKNKKGETLLHIAAMKGEVEDLRALISEGADLNAKDNAGWTPLHEACNHGHLGVVNELVVAGALVNTPGYNDETPLMDAVLNGHSDIVKILLKHRADVSQRNASGETASNLTEDSSIHQLLEEYKFTSEKNTFAMELDVETLQEYAPEEIIISYSSTVSNETIKKGKKALNATLNTKDAIAATHYIVPSYEDGRSPRTIKYMQAIARGIWILKCEWLEACSGAEDWVLEQNFEISGSKEDIVLGGPKKSRLNKLAQCPAIFHGCHFYLSGSFKSSNPSKQQLGELLQLSGGVLLTREPKPDSDSIQTCTKVPYHALKESAQYFYTYYIVYDGSQGKPSRMVRQGKVCSVPLTWIFDCISQFYFCEIP